MGGWEYLIVLVCGGVLLRYTVFRAPSTPVAVLIENDTESRFIKREREREQAFEIARKNKLSISLDLLEFERKKARAEHVQSIYASLVEKIKKLNVSGHRRHDAGHPCESLKDWDYHFRIARLRPYPLPLSESERAEIAESNAICEEVATMLRRNGLGVDTDGKMDYSGSIYDRERMQNRMIITW